MPLQRKENIWNNNFSAARKQAKLFSTKQERKMEKFADVRWSGFWGRGKWEWLKKSINCNIKKSLIGSNETLSRVVNIEQYFQFSLSKRNENAWKGKNNKVSPNIIFPPSWSKSKKLRKILKTFVNFFVSWLQVGEITWHCCQNIKPHPLAPCLHQG